MTLHVLDCTLRDGGYYNYWDFSPAIIEKYLDAVCQAGVNAIEIGFRMPAQNRFLGALAYSTDEYLRHLPLPKDILIGVMVNAKEIIAGPNGIEKTIARMFCSANDAPIGLVRIAAHFDEISSCQIIAGKLKSLGYQVGLNMMQASEQSPEALTAAAKTAATWGSVDMLYFADSLGNMNDADVRATTKAFAEGWKGPLGIHAHNNMGQALANTLSAMDAGITWLDSTIFGMGRGAGNANTEYLLVELNRQGLGDFHPDALFPLILDEFQKLHQQYNWGPSLLYFLSGAYGIHPTYVQEMLQLEDHSAEHVVSALEILRKGDAYSYNTERLNEAMQSVDVSFPGSWSAEGWASGRDVLLVGAGPWVRDHREALLDFIDRTNPMVICLNTTLDIPTDRITAYVACHAVRFAMEANHYSELKAPLIAPIAAFSKSVQQSFGDIQIFDYGMAVTRGKFQANASDCVIPHRLAAAYAFAVANAAGAKRILMAGFDGYDKSDSRQVEMEDALAAYAEIKDSAPLVAVTPTTYSITQSSIFAPEV